MSFHSLAFFGLLISVLLIYYHIPVRFRAFLIAGANLMFYLACGWQNTVLLLCMTVWSYFLARQIEKAASRKKWLVFCAISVVLAQLLFFKYAPLFSADFLKQPAPLGVSFYTFLLIAYLADVARGTYKAEQNFLYFFAFAAYFPLISSGPIARAEGLLPQFRQEKTFQYEVFCTGCSRILWGFFKKFVVADTIGQTVNAVFLDVSAYTGPYLLLASLLYSYQLYCDFSGYSDIAIGTAHTFGFVVKENFARPFAARSFQDLWARWHISLTSWFRDYVYFPLGGSRAGTMRTYVNILVVFLLSGIWHGAGLTFIIWGLLNGLYMVLERAVCFHQNRRVQSKKRLQAVFQIIGVYLMFTSCIVFFRAETWQDAVTVYSNLLTGWDTLLQSPSLMIETLKSIEIGRVTGILMLSSILLCEVVEWFAAQKKLTTGAFLRTLSPVKRMSMYYLLILFILVFGKMGTSSFIYFAF